MKDTREDRAARETFLSELVRLASRSDWWSAASVVVTEEGAPNGGLSVAGVFRTPTGDHSVDGRTVAAGFTVLYEDTLVSPRRSTVRRVPTLTRERLLGARETSDLTDLGEDDATLLVQLGLFREVQS